MARPLSEEKRSLILEATTQLVAQFGTSAPTAKIAKVAGLAEGTLFTYFATKDVLLNALLLAIEEELAEALLLISPISDSPRSRVQGIWNCIVDWGLENPLKRRTMQQLLVSDRITEENRKACRTLFKKTSEVIEDSLSARIDPSRADFYINSVMMGLADLTIEAIAARPADRDHLKLAGFDLFWNGIAA